MAGDWIKVEKVTARKPEVLMLADKLSIHPDHAFGMCVRFWFWCDDQLATGHAPRVTNVTLDSVFGHVGFVDALIEVGWLIDRQGSLEVPRFDRHLSESAKSRALSSERKRKQRDPKRDPNVSRSERDKIATSEARDSLNSPSNSKSPEKTQEFPSELDTERFRSSWSKWVQHRSEIRKALKPTQVDSQLKMLAGKGEAAAIAMIEHTVAMGWQGLREPEGKSGGHADDDPRGNKAAMRRYLDKFGNSPVDQP